MLLTNNKQQSDHRYHLLQFSGGRPNVAPLFIIPGSGGKSLGYRILGDALRDYCAVYGIEMLGTQKGELPLDTIEDIAALNIHWIKCKQPAGPYRFIGHSFGSYVMYEMTRQLEDLGDEVGFIAVLDQEIEHCVIPPKVKESVYALQLAGDYFESFKILHRPHPDWVHDLRLSLEGLEKQAMVPFISNFVGDRMPSMRKRIEYFSRLINIRLHNDLVSYALHGRLKAPVILLRAEENSGNQDPTLGWSAYAGNVQVVEVAGNHHTMMRPRHVMSIVRSLTPFLHSHEKSAATQVNMHETAPQMTYQV
jgi:thioesterase domain-containing protein